MVFNCSLTCKLTDHFIRYSCTITINAVKYSSNTSCNTLIRLLYYKGVLMFWPPLYKVNDGPKHLGMHDVTQGGVCMSSVCVFPMWLWQWWRDERSFPFSEKQKWHMLLYNMRHYVTNRQIGIRRLCFQPLTFSHSTFPLIESKTVRNSWDSTKTSCSFSSRCLTKVHLLAEARLQWSVTQTIMWLSLVSPRPLSALVCLAPCLHPHLSLFLSHKWKVVPVGVIWCLVAL